MQSLLLSTTREAFVCEAYKYLSHALSMKYITEGIYNTTSNHFHQLRARPPICDLNIVALPELLEIPE